MKKEEVIKLIKDDSIPDNEIKNFTTAIAIKESYTHKEFDENEIMKMWTKWKQERIKKFSS